MAAVTLPDASTSPRPGVGRPDVRNLDVRNLDVRRPGVLRRFCGYAAVIATLLVQAGCTAGPSRTPEAARPETTLPDAGTAVVGGDDAAELALATSRALYRHAPAVVLAGAAGTGADGTGADGAGADGTGLAAAISTALRLGVPLLLAPGPEKTDAAAQLRAELSRLAPRSIVAMDDAATRWATDAAPTRDGAAIPVVPADGAALAEVTPAAPLDELLVLTLDRPGSGAATATARASGARVLVLADPDPRAADSVISALAGQSTERVLALGDAFGTAERLRRRIDSAATGVALPGGGQVLFPGRRMVALYGHPGDPGLGVLGEQPVAAAVARARRLADSYRAVTKERVVPAFEIIATVASSEAGPDGDYSSESSVAHLQPWVDAARDAGIYVVLDLQPGRTDFLSQAKRYEPLLRQPHVGLALDPEWRLAPGQRHMVQIGSVTAAEINQTATWLADLTRSHKLPQKVLMLHQFRLDMITDRASVDTGHDELAVVIHVDGFGTAGQKFDTWRALQAGPPPNVSWGWKNFYDEDRPTFTPQQTLAITPPPVFVSYQ